MNKQLSECDTAAGHLRESALCTNHGCCCGPDYHRLQPHTAARTAPLTHLAQWIQDLHEYPCIMCKGLVCLYTLAQLSLTLMLQACSMSLRAFSAALYRLGSWTLKNLRAPSKSACNRSSLDVWKETRRSGRRENNKG